MAEEFYGQRDVMCMPEPKEFRHLSTSSLVGLSQPQRKRPILNCWDESFGTKFANMKFTTVALLAVAAAVVISGTGA
jgi:hypothetical protein